MFANFTFFRSFKNAGSAAREMFIFQIFFIHQDHERLLQLQHCHVCSMATVTASWLIGDEWKSFDYFRLFSVFARIRMVAKGTAVKCFLCHASVPYNSNDRQVQPDLMIHKHSTNCHSQLPRSRLLKHLEEQHAAFSGLEFLAAGWKTKHAIAIWSSVFGHSHGID